MPKDLVPETATKAWELRVVDRSDDSRSFNFRFEKVQDFAVQIPVGSDYPTLVGSSYPTEPSLSHDAIDCVELLRDYFQRIHHPLDDAVLPEDRFQVTGYGNTRFEVEISRTAIATYRQVSNASEDLHFYYNKAPRYDFMDLMGFTPSSHFWIAIHVLWQKFPQPTSSSNTTKQSTLIVSKGALQASLLSQTS